MNYIVLEIKTTSGVTTFVNPASYTSKNAGLSAYHSLCATASVSNVEHDTVILLNEKGLIVEKSCFVHSND